MNQDCNTDRCPKERVLVECRKQIEMSQRIELILTGEVARLSKVATEALAMVARLEGGRK